MFLPQRILLLSLSRNYIVAEIKEAEKAIWDFSDIFPLQRNAYEC